MQYQLGRFDPSSESWNFYRSDWPEHAIIAFPSLEEAEAKAVELSAELSNRVAGYREVLVLTLHSCFKTETEYPKVDPIRRTRRLDLSFGAPVSVGAVARADGGVDASPRATASSRCVFKLGDDARCGKDRDHEGPHVLCPLKE